MITLHCQEHDGQKNHKCGLVWMAIQNGVVMVTLPHNGEKHINVISCKDLLRLLQEEMESREKVLQF